jgi:5'-methylthioadenosine phosphorylase
MNEKIKIGVFGGSGLYNLLDDVEEIIVDTPYGAPSAPVAAGTVGGQRVAFLPRHGKNHQYPAHAVNYRANIFALKSLGVERIIAPCSCGSLQKRIKPGDFVVLDQFVDRTRMRKDTFYDGANSSHFVVLDESTGKAKDLKNEDFITTHISAADPYCSQLSKTIIDSLDELGFGYHKSGTMVVIQGPRFSTRAESKWFSSQGWDVVGMTQYPEVVLAREQEICYTGIALSTDYDVGLEDDSDIKPVTGEEVLKVFKMNIEKVQKLIFTAIPKISEVRSCDCGTALTRARFL